MRAIESGLLSLLRWVPLGLLSSAAGKLAGLPLPWRLRAPAWRLFGKLVGVDFSEVRDPLSSFASLQDFFTRALVAGIRPVDPAAQAVVAPCDGAWGASGRVERGALFQVKGRSYRLADLVQDDALAERLEGGAYATFYLAPRNYHRFHAPCDAWVRRAVRVPGQLWPVNRMGVEGVDGLFARNERLVVQMSLVPGVDVPNAAADPVLCVVAVGAMMVGKIRVDFDDLTTRTGDGSEAKRDFAAPGIPLEKGVEWGRFEFGSTLVMVSAPGSMVLEGCTPGTPVQVGERIGRLEVGGKMAGRTGGV